MRELFGPSARGFELVASAGLILAIVFALFPTALILIAVGNQVATTGSFAGPLSAALDERNLAALTNSLFVGAITAGSLVFLARTFALLIQRLGMTGDPVVYALALIPLLMPDYLAGIAGYALLEPQFGLLAPAIPDRLFVDRFGALLAIAGVTTLKWLPVMIVLIDAQLASIPANVLRQAQLDFSRRTDLVRIVLAPQIARVTPLALALGFFAAFRQHELATQLTGQGGGFQAEMWSNWNYRTIFEFFNLAAASAQALLTIIILLIPLEALIRFAPRLRSSE